MNVHHKLPGVIVALVESDDRIQTIERVMRAMTAAKVPEDYKREFELTALGSSREELMHLLHEVLEVR